MGRKARARLVKNLIQETAEERGRANEKRFLELCMRQQKSFPTWLLRIEEVKTDEERIGLGVDAWAITADAGRIGLQVKTSVPNRLVYEERTANLPEGLRPFPIVIAPQRKDEDIVRELIQALTYIREQRLSPKAKSA